MNKVIGAVMIAVALAGCTAGSGYDAAPDIAPGAVAAAKADGAFGSVEIALGETATGNVAGTALSLFALTLEETDQFRVTVTRTAGDLAPSAYLYRGTEEYIAPDDYETGPGLVSLNYTVARGGQYHIVVKAYRGQGVGEFALTTECTGGACSGLAIDPVDRQSNCIQGAALCAVADLPRWGGTVDAAQSREIFDDCLAAQADPGCGAACDGDGEAVCDGIIGELPGLAEETPACHEALTACVVECDEMASYYGPSSIDESAAMVCWDGYFGDCMQFISEHSACGGSEYDAGTTEECMARCEAATGAWDEGPYDGCDLGC